MPINPQAITVKIQFLSIKINPRVPYHERKAEMHLSYELFVFDSSILIKSL
tara:strand:+ start:327 stop:479 length:153 start_codon:yes stop_codon:yes gene_type:complete